MKNINQLAKIFESKLSTASYRDQQTPAGGETKAYDGPEDTSEGFSGVEPTMTPQVEKTPHGGFGRASILIGGYLKKVLDEHTKTKGTDLPAVVHVSVGGSSVGYFVYDPYAGEYAKSGNYIDEIELTDDELKEIISGSK
jgi:hypothetical protein